MIGFLQNKTKHSEPDPHFSKWAIDSIQKWDRTEVQPGIVRIHGGKDKVLPIGNEKVDYFIPNGSHFMVFNRADHVSEFVREAGIS